ncbi:MAG: porin family protein [Rhizobacter sp.]|nr:porin family protein [Ferruginibacter sp.]
MDKKRFDHIEQQMKAAAEGWEPAFDEKAWDQMEQMLEGDNDRKKPVAWWIWLLPLFLVIGTGIYFMTREEKKKDQQIAVVNNIPAGKNNAPADKIISSHTIPANNTTVPLVPVSGNNESATLTIEKKDTDNIFNRPQNVTRKRAVPASDKNNDATGSGKNYDTRKIKDEQKARMNISVNGVLASGKMEDTTVDAPSAVPSAKEEQKAVLIKTENDKKTTVALSSTTNEEKKKKEESEKDIAAKRKNKQPSRFYFSIVAGIEGNGVNFPGTNKFGTRAGFTAGYQLTKNLSIQTGFFAGSKKYVAGKNDYKAKAGSYWSTVEITRVDANCRVFEIPVSLRYDFDPSKKWNAFAGAGLSSYFMDKEDYEYDYIRNSNPYHAKASYKGNQHLFSVLRLSGGIERKISPQFSLGINPGIAIPLAGVGEGQIKLFSTEFLLSLKYRPFKKSK